MTKPKRKKEPLSTSDKVVIAAVVAVILVFAAELTLRAFDKEGLSDRFITCWYTFWGSELAFLAGIKITKVRTSPFAPSDDEADDDAAG
jgi:hypothetical protein